MKTRCAWLLIVCACSLSLAACGEDEETPTCPSEGVTTLIDEAEGLSPFRIDSYEASRADATATAQGESDGPACSVPGVVPWSMLTAEEAASACAASGKRLCTIEEWQAACGSLRGRSHPYDGAYRAGACNDESGDGAVAATGAYTDCRSDQGAYDLNGNLREWVQDADATRFAGGSYASSELDASCGRGLVPQDDGVGPGNGFRCCQDL